MNSDLVFYIYIVFCGVVVVGPVEERLRRILGPIITWGLGALLLFIIVVMFLWQGDLFSENAPLGPWMRFVFSPLIFLDAAICSDCIRYYVPRIFRKGRN